jgi:hypothetical protein
VALDSVKVAINIIKSHSGLWHQLENRCLEEGFAPCKSPQPWTRAFTQTIGEKFRQGLFFLTRGDRQKSARFAEYCFTDLITGKYKFCHFVAAAIVDLNRAIATIENEPVT